MLQGHGLSALSHEPSRWSKRRWLALALAPIGVLLIARTLAGFALVVQPYLGIHYDLWFELGMVIGQVVFQWCVMWRRSWTERVDYAFILLGVSGLGAALLWPLLLWNGRAAVTPLAAVAYFFAVVGVMFLAHWRLVARFSLPLLLCGTWVIYRLLLLLFIVKH